MGKSEVLNKLQIRFDALFTGFDKKYVASKKNKIPTQLEYYIISEVDKDGISPHIVIQENRLDMYLKYPCKNIIYSGLILSDVSILDIIQCNFENLDLLLLRRDLKRFEYKLKSVEDDITMSKVDKVIEIEELKCDIRELKKLLQLYK